MQDIMKKMRNDDKKQDSVHSVITPFVAKTVQKSQNSEPKNVAELMAKIRNDMKDVEKINNQQIFIRQNNTNSKLQIFNHVTLKGL